MSYIQPSMATLATLNEIANTAPEHLPSVRKAKLEFTCGINPQTYSIMFNKHRAYDVQNLHDDYYGNKEVKQFVNGFFKHKCPEFVQAKKTEASKTHTYKVDQPASPQPQTQVENSHNVQSLAAAELHELEVETQAEAIVKNWESAEKIEKMERELAVIVQDRKELQGLSEQLQKLKTEFEEQKLDGDISIPELKGMQGKTLDLIQHPSVDRLSQIDENIQEIVYDRQELKQIKEELHVIKSQAKELQDHLMMARIKMHVIGKNQTE